MSRLTFLFWCLASAALCAAPQGETPVRAGMGIMVGEVTSSSALVQVRLTKADYLIDRDVAIRPVFRFVPTLTRSSVRFIGHDHTFVGDKATRDFGYAPIYSESEAIERTHEIRYRHTNPVPGMCSPVRRSSIHSSPFISSTDQLNSLCTPMNSS